MASLADRALELQLRGRFRFGVGAVAALPELVRGLGGERVFVVSDPGVVASGGETDTTELLISVTLPPTAALSTTSPLREAPLTLTYSAAASTDSDGEVVRYLWDMDGDGVYELDAGPISQRQVLYPAAGDHTVGVKVLDNLGASDTAVLSVSLTDDYGESEDNDSPLQATALGDLAPGSSVAGLKGGLGLGNYDGDQEDWFAFDVPAGVDLAVQLDFVHADANLDLELYGDDALLPLASARSQLDGELLVYDLSTHRAHSLNAAAASVWKRCDGEHSVAQIAAEIAVETTEAANPDAVYVGLGALDKAGLLAAWSHGSDERAGLTRRELVKRAAVLSAALPVVTSIIAPAAAVAAPNVRRDIAPFRNAALSASVCSSHIKKAPESPPGASEA